jgi:hypothetical protein
MSRPISCGIPVLQPLGATDPIATAIRDTTSDQSVRAAAAATVHHS